MSQNWNISCNVSVVISAAADKQNFKSFRGHLVVTVHP